MVKRVPVHAADVAVTLSEDLPSLGGGRNRAAGGKILRTDNFFCSDLHSRAPARMAFDLARGFLGFVKRS